MRPREFEKSIVTNDIMKTFWKNGFSATSIEHLIKETKLSRSSLYNTFGNKELLFELALNQYNTKTSENIALLSKPIHSKIKIHNFMISVIEDELTNKRGFGCLIANSSLEVAGDNEKFSNLIDQHFSRLEEALNDVIICGQENEEISKAYNSQALAIFILTTIQGLRVIGKGSSKEKKSKRLHDVVNTALSIL